MGTTVNGVMSVKTGGAVKSAKAAVTVANIPVGNVERAIATVEDVRHVSAYALMTFVMIVEKRCVLAVGVTVHVKRGSVSSVSFVTPVVKTSVRNVRCVAVIAAQSVTAVVASVTIL